jgi:hypothetical protein
MHASVHVITRLLPPYNTQLTRDGRLSSISRLHCCWRRLIKLRVRVRATSQLAACRQSVHDHDNHHGYFQLKPCGSIPYVIYLLWREDGLVSYEYSQVVWSDYRRDFGLDIEFNDHLQIVIANNYNTIAIFTLIKIRLFSFPQCLHLQLSDNGF